MRVVDGSKSSIISIHALLAESDPPEGAGKRQPAQISIHALLAESDCSGVLPETCRLVFLSTLSLRRATAACRPPCSCRIFLSTLSLRRATRRRSGLFEHRRNFYPRSPCGERPLRPPAWGCHSDFYPRSPCGERRILPHHARKIVKFLSTLSLRRATDIRANFCLLVYYFYPRSPCGERLDYYVIRF